MELNGIVYTIKLPKKYKKYEREYETLARRCISLCQESGAAIRGPIEFTMTSRISELWGYCYPNDNPQSFQIVLSSVLFESDVPYAARKNILLHELCHTAEDGFEHEGVWEEETKKITRRSHYKIKLKAQPSENDLGLPKNFSLLHSRYPMLCTKCGKAYERNHWCQLTRHPEKYACAECGGKIVETTREELLKKADKKAETNTTVVFQSSYMKLKLFDENGIRSLREALEELEEE